MDQVTVRSIYDWIDKFLDKFFVGWLLMVVRMTTDISNVSEIITNRDGLVQNLA